MSMKKFRRLALIVGFMFVGVIAIGFTACEAPAVDPENDNNNNNNNSNTEYGWYGDGSSSNFTIRNDKQLQEFGKIVADGGNWTDKDGKYHSVKKSDFRGKTVTLADDIDLGGISNWTAIGNSSTAYEPFNGTFDGNNKTLSGLNAFRGLFSNIGVDGTVKNLTIDGLNGRQGGLAMTNRGRVQNINIIDGNLSSDTSESGGVIGSNYGIVEDCSFSGNISGSSVGGGIAGYNNKGGVIQNCSATGHIISNSSGWGSGGIAGSNHGVIEKCYSACTVGNGNNSATGGGIAGSNDGTVKNCYATGDIKGNNAGGVVGGNSAGTIQYCYATGNISGSNRIGGITGGSMGSGNTSTVQNCVALNPSVSETTDNSSFRGYSGRVTSGYGIPSLSNNYGLDGMSVNGSVTITVTPDASGKHGANVEATDYNSQTWWETTVSWDFNTVWKWDNERKLPKL